MSDRLSFTAASSSDRVSLDADRHAYFIGGGALATFWRGAGSSRLPRLMVVLAAGERGCPTFRVHFALSVGHARGPPTSEFAPVPTHNPFLTAALPPLYPDKPLKLTALWSSSPRFVRFRATDQFPFFVLTDRFDTPFVSLPLSDREGEKPGHEIYALLLPLP